LTIAVRQASVTCVQLLPPSRVRQMCGSEVVEAERVDRGVGGVRVEVRGLEHETLAHGTSCFGVAFVHALPLVGRHVIRPHRCRPRSAASSGDGAIA
jgi:hypothetical protein